MRGHGEHALRCGLHFGQKSFPAGVDFHARVLVVVESRALEFRVFQRKTQRFDQMQLRARIGAQADHIARIRWNFRLN